MKKLRSGGVAETDAGRRVFAGQDLSRCGFWQRLVFASGGVPGGNGAFLRFRPDFG